MKKGLSSFNSFNTIRLNLLIALSLLLACCQNRLPQAAHSSFILNDSVWKLENFITTINAVANTNEFIFIGTDHGLFRIDKSNNNTKSIESLAEFKVRYLIPEGENMLRLNDGYLYDFKTDALSGIYRQDNIKAVKLHGSLILALQFDNTLLLIKNRDTIEFKDYSCDSFNNLIIDKDFIWIPGDLRKGIYRYSIETGNLDLIKIGYDFRNYSVQGNDSLLLITNNEGILEFNKTSHKAYFSRMIDGKLNSDKRDVKELFLEEAPFFNYVSAELTVFTGDIRASFDKFTEINSKYQGLANRRIQDKLGELRTSLITLLPLSFEQAKNLEKFCIDTVRDSVVIAGYYHHMIKMAIYEGKLKDALYYDDLLSNKYPGSGKEAHTSIIKKVNQTETYLSSLSKNLPEDEFLWLTGKAYYDLFLIAGPASKGNINMTYPFSFLKKLKKNFPGSIFDDNADFLMLSHIEGMTAKDANLYQKVMNEYKALMQKYPSSELQPQFMERLARMSYRYIPEDGNRLKYLEESQKYISDLQRGYPEYFRENDIQSLVTEIEEGLSKSRWEFSVETKKKSLNPNEPVVLTFRMTNTDTKPKTLKISDDKSLPNFIITVQHYGLFADYLIEELTLQPDFHSYIKTSSDTLVAPGASYSETWNIKERSRTSFSQPAGKFVFNQTGRYKITCMPINESFTGFIKPETITITLSDQEQGNSPF